MKVSIVTPNYNGKHLLEKNLLKVSQIAGINEIVVVDDGSTDGSIFFIKKHFPQVKLIEKITNSGFATSVNLGFKAVTGDIIILLNTDVIPRQDFLSPLIKHFADPKVFAVGCLDISFEGKNLIKRGRGIGRFERGFLIHARGEVDQTNTLWASGGSSAFRKSIWEKLGAMDELYNPFYWEDIDICYRAQKAGFKILFEPKSIVEHRHQAGSITANYSPLKIKTIAYRNQFIFVWNNITDIKYVWQHLFWLPYHLLKAVITKDFDLIAGFLSAVIKLPQIWPKRLLNRKLSILSDRQILAQFT